MIKSVFLIGFCSLGFMVTAHAANIDLPGGDAMVSDTAYESYSYNSVDMDLVEAQFRRHSGPVVAQTVKNGRRTVEQAKAYMDGNAKLIKVRCSSLTMVHSIFAFLCLIQVLKVRRLMITLIPLLMS